MNDERDPLFQNAIENRAREATALREEVASLRAIITNMNDTTAAEREATALLMAEAEQTAANLREAGVMLLELKHKSASREAVLVLALRNLLGSAIAVKGLSLHVLEMKNLAQRIKETEELLSVMAAQS